MANPDNGDFNLFVDDDGTGCAWQSCSIGMNRHVGGLEPYRLLLHWNHHVQFSLPPLQLRHLQRAHPGRAGALPPHVDRPAHG